MKIRKFKIGKLIRDNSFACENIVEIKKHILNDKDYDLELRRKLIEEAYEVANSSEAELIEELADVLEVINTLAKFHGSNINEIDKVRLEKNQKRGGFNSRVYCESVCLSEQSRLYSYYIDNPDRYPEDK